MNVSNKSERYVSGVCILLTRLAGWLVALLCEYTRDWVRLPEASNIIGLFV